MNPAESQVSVPGALAFVLDEATAGGPPEAFQAGREFAHLHPQEDGSLHMMLPPEVAAEAYRKGWGEPHPRSGTPLFSHPATRTSSRLSGGWCAFPTSTPPATGANR